MSFYSDASLVMIPSGYKTSKVYSAVPTDGAGDLSFSRSNDTATRVNSAGLIEKVRTNVLTYSQDFSNANWVGFDVSRTDSQTDPNGGTTASLYTSLTSSANVTANFSTASSSPYTLSIYIKGTSSGSVSLRVDSPSLAPVNIINYTTSWQRFTYTFTAGASTSTIVLGGYASFTPSEGIYLAFAQAELGDIATDYIATTSAAVSVGPVANVPRLDYLGSTCGPRLLLEGQRTNNFTFSEDFNNAAWIKIDTTITANTTISPDGYQNADTMTTTANTSRLVGNILTGAGTFTISCYVKRLTGNDNFQFRLVVDGANQSQSFVVTNEWQRFTFTVTAALSVTSPQLRSSGAGTGTFAIWGAQFEQGAYATSYIPTLGAAVTRGADDCNKTGISSLVSTTGTLFIDFVWNGVSDGVADNTIFGQDPQYYGTTNISISNYNGNLYGRVSDGLSIVANLNANIVLTAGIRYKVAFAFQNNDIVLFVNGTLRNFATSGTIPVTSSVYLNNNHPNNKSVNQALVFKTRLSNADLAALTTI